MLRKNNFSAKYRLSANFFYQAIVEKGLRMYSVVFLISPSQNRQRNNQSYHGFTSFFVNKICFYCISCYYLVPDEQKLCKNLSPRSRIQVHETMTGS